MPPRSPQARWVLDLSGTWECCPAADEAAAPPPDAAWRPIAVPANWHLAGLPNYSGTVFYRRDFTLDQRPADAASRALLRFHGVDYFAQVWLDRRTQAWRG